MKKYSIILFSIWLLLNGCLDDTGNYVYEDIGLVTGVKNVEESYTVKKAEDFLEIAPQFEIEGGISQEDISCEWYIGWPYVLTGGENNILVSTERNLKVFIDDRFPLTDKGYVTLKAVDNRTGVKYAFKYDLQVVHPLKKGLFILGEKDGNTVLPLQKIDGEIIPDLYSTLMGTQLAGKPKIMGFYGASLGGKNKSFLNIYTTAKETYGAIVNFTDLTYHAPIEKCFDGGLSNGNIQNFQLGLLVRDIFIKVNDYLYRHNGRFLSGAFCYPYVDIDFPMIETPIDTAMFSVGTLYIEKETKQMGYINSGGAVMKVKTQENVPIEMPGECVGFGTEPGSPFSQQRIHFLVKNGGVVTDYIITGNFMSGAMSYLKRNTFSAPELIVDNTKFTSSYSQRYLYFCSGNAVYRYNYDVWEVKPTKIYEFEEGYEISVLEMKKKGAFYAPTDDKLVVAAHKPGVANSAIFMYLSKKGEVLERIENLCDRIVDYAIIE